MILHRRCLGFALVIILGLLALLVALGVGFLTRATAEKAASSSFKASSSARQLADSAVSLVQGQISTAIAQSAVSWVSQPGMVRTFDANGSLVQAYKLYSSTNMISNSVDIVAGKSADEPPASWGADVACWTDLNAPIQSGTGYMYPILDPNATAEGYVISLTSGATAIQPAPMPVRWLYVLQNGDIAVPTGGSGKTATLPEDTALNPIVGRIAFWTDDESCKVNINTASEGTYWDVPRARTNQEVVFAQNPPWQKEFQRYPGHPAMTSLSTVFPKPSGYTDQTWAEQIYKIIPRIVGGGSQEGTVTPSAAATALVPDTDRLYANIDELVFTPSRGNNAGLTQTQLERARFFLTAHSRAPETNLFNLPRVACWPVFKDLAAGRVTAFDRLIAFCASTGSAGIHPYYFQREISDSPTSDISISRNQELYSYLQYLTKTNIPGFGGNFSTKYGDDRDQILTEIFDYIRSTNLYDDTLAAGQRFTPDQGIAGHGFVAPIQYTTPGGTATMGFGRAYTLSELGIGFICNAAANDPTTPATDESYGSNDPAKNTVLEGTLLNSGERYIQAIIVPEFFSPMAGYTNINPNMRIEISGLNQLTITKGSKTANLFPDVVDGDAATYTANPASFYSGVDYGGNPSWRYFGDGKLSPQRGNLVADTPATGSFYPFIGKPIKLTAVTTGDTMTFKGATITVKIYSSATGGNLIQTLNINLPSGPFPIPNLVNQSVAGDTTAASTTKENWWAFSKTGAAASYPGRLAFINLNPGTIYGVKSGAFFLNNFDVLRTVMPRHGDYRLVAANNNVSAATYPMPATPGSAFYKHRYYDTTTTMMASNLSNAQNTQLDQGYDRGGKYISTVTYPALFSPDIPSDATQTPESTGDFDDCLPPTVDGPFVNKPDEGNNPTTGSPYFNTGYSVPGSTFFSPNRQIPSPGMFGSLPTGVKAGVPWRTLLFRHQPSHFGAATAPEDHLWLDLFWMPVVEPYAISDRFSTAGKINMNYQILPFTYIERSTGVRALLKSEMVTAVPNNVFVPTVNLYKFPGTNSTSEFRFAINSDETLSQFSAKFTQGNIFKSASEICDLDIVPTGQTAGGMSTFWNNNLTAGHALTAENLRERIYTTLYPRLTTKSNTFTVHFQAQALKKTRNSAVGTWTEGKDLVTGEYRGSAIIERFIDANNAKIPDYAADAKAGTVASDPTLDTFYKWRVISNRQFAP
ncbi:MAG: Verru_Chthon cassette protein A [Chthoniobacteraceae bacterium]